MRSIKEQLFRQAEDYFFRACSLQYMPIGSAATAYTTGVAVPDLNLLYVRNNTLPLAKILEEAESFYGSLSMPHMLLLPNSLRFKTQEATLSEYKYRSVRQTVAMGMELEGHGSLADNQALRFERTDACLSEWILPLTEAFSTPFELALAYANRHAEGIKNGFNLYHFSAYSDEALVASFTLSVCGNIARIDDLGVLPSYQGQGIAKACLELALFESQRLQAEYCFLEAATAAERLYHKFGFETLFQYTNLAK